jgi:adenylate kinase family enzyme
MKITILGLPGSGKSTLAKKISKQENIPYINIDGFWHEGGGDYNSRTTPDPEKTHAYVQEKVLESIKQDSWVSDGFYPLIQVDVSEQAGTIIFLDISLWKRLINHVKRIFTGSKSEMTLWGNIAFFFEMIKMGSSGTARVYKFLENYKEKVVILKSRKESNEYIRKLN